MTVLGQMSVLMAGGSGVGPNPSVSLPVHHFDYPRIILGLAPWLQCSHVPDAHTDLNLGSWCWVPSASVADRVA